MTEEVPGWIKARIDAREQLTTCQCKSIHFCCQIHQEHVLPHRNCYMR